MQKEETSLLTGMRSFMWFHSSTQMEMLWKINDCKSLENFRKNVYDGVCFNKIASLCCTNYNSTKTRFHCKLFSECVPKDYIPGFTTEVSPRGFCKIAVYKILEKSLRDIFVIPYLTKLLGLQYIGCNFTKKEVFYKNI